MNDLCKKISVVMPTYNSEKYVEESIISVIYQTHQNWELIIIDNCSLDKTINIVKRIMKSEKRIKFIQNKENKGIAFSRNEGIQNSSGDYIAFLDSDDLWKANKLELQLKFMLENDLDFSFTDFCKINSSGETIGLSRNALKILAYKDILKANYIGTLTVMIKANIQKVFLMPALKYEDYATWLMIMKSGVNAYHLNLTLACYRVHNSFSKNKFKSLTWTYKVYQYVTERRFLIPTFLTCRFIYITIVAKYLNKRGSERDEDWLCK